MKNNYFLLAALFAALFFTACKKGGKTGLLIPKDAGLALHMDLSSLSSKLSWDEIKQTAWFAEALSKTKDSLAKKLLNDPAASGIDTKGSLVLFMKRNGANGYAAFEGKLVNATQFSKMIEEAGKGKVKIEKDGNLNFAKNTDGADAVVYFNDKQFVLIADASGMEQQMPGGRNNNRGTVQKYSMDSLQHFAKSTFELKGDDLLDSDKRFEQLINDKADMHYWMNSGNFYSGMLPGMLSMLKLSALLENNISAGKLNFDNGKIAVDSRNYYGKELTDLLKKYSGKEVSNDIVNHLPDQDVLAAFAMNYPPDGLKEFLKLLGVDGIANAALGQLGISTDDIIKGNKGDLAFALTGFEINRTPSSVALDNGEKIPYDKENTKINFVFGTSVNDKASFQKIIDVFETKLKNQIPGKDSTANNLKHKLQDNWFALGSTDSAVDAFLAGNKKPAYAQAFTGHNGGGYFDLQKILTTALNNNKDTSVKKNIEISAAFWKNATMHWDIKNGEAVSKIEVTLADTGTNALKQLNKYIDQMYLAAPKKGMDEDSFDFPVADSIAVQP